MVTDYMVLINGENPIPEDYESTTERISVQNSFGDRFEVERKTCEAFSRLRRELLEKDDIQIELVSAYRTIAFQRDTYDRHLKESGPEFTNKYVARPGHSEHHTGLAIDVGVVVDGVLRRYSGLRGLEDIFRIIHARLPRFGFILRYPRGKEPITKIGYECWHFRYLDSPEIAREITEKGWCFEEYFENK